MNMTALNETERVQISLRNKIAIGLWRRDIDRHCGFLSSQFCSKYCSSSIFDAEFAFPPNKDAIASSPESVFSADDRLVLEGNTDNSCTTLLVDSLTPGPSPSTDKLQPTRILLILQRN